MRSPRVDRRNARRFGSPMSFVELSAHFAVDAMPADRSVGRSAYEAALLCLTARSGTSSRASERLTSRTSRATSSGCRRVMKCSASITRTSSRCSSAYLRPASDNMLSPSPMSALVGVVSQALFRLSSTGCANPTQRIGMPSFVSAWSTRGSSPEHPVNRWPG